MAGRRTGIWVAIGISLLCFLLNGGLFIYFYNQLATPFLGEEQRVANADYIMTVASASFALVAAVIGLITYLLTKQR